MYGSLDPGSSDRHLQALDVVRDLKRAVYMAHRPVERACRGVHRLERDVGPRARGSGSSIDPQVGANPSPFRTRPAVGHHAVVDIDAHREAVALVGRDRPDAGGELVPTRLLARQEPVAAGGILRGELLSGVVDGLRIPRGLEIVTGDGSSHVLPLERPADFNRLVMKFLTE